MYGVIYHFIQNAAKGKKKKRGAKEMMPSLLGGHRTKHFFSKALFPPPNACLREHLHETRIFISDSHLHARLPFFLFLSRFSCRGNTEGHSYPRGRIYQCSDVSESPSLSAPHLCLHWKDFMFPGVGLFFFGFFFLSSFSSCTPKRLTNRVPSVRFFFLAADAVLPEFGAANCRLSEAADWAQLVSAYAQIKRRYNARQKDAAATLSLIKSFSPTFFSKFPSLLVLFGLFFFA
ncbi:hypothetical protein V8C35DRAFT_11966 [Trichoderma chlorosporum]